MQYRTHKGGVVVTEQDQCWGCHHNFMGQVRCPGVTALWQALGEGYEFTVRHCPHYQPQAGTGRKRHAL